MADNYDNSGALWKRQPKDSDVAGKNILSMREI